IIPSRPCVATNSESGAGEEDKEVERRSFARPTQVYRSSKAPTLTPQAIDPVVGPGPHVCVHSFLLSALVSFAVDLISISVELLRVVFVLRRLSTFFYVSREVHRGGSS
ncbi:hypothetical protein BHM03_00052571, partial [Ensete ventricosum]